MGPYQQAALSESSRAHSILTWRGSSPRVFIVPSSRRSRKPGQEDPGASRHRDSLTLADLVKQLRGSVRVIPPEHPSLAGRPKDLGEARPARVGRSMRPALGRSRPPGNRTGGVAPALRSYQIDCLSTNSRQVGGANVAAGALAALLRMARSYLRTSLTKIGLARAGQA